MAADFGDAYAKLDRADTHLAELRGHVLDHMRRTDLVTGTVVFDPAIRTLDKSGLRVQPVPSIISVVAGDVVHNLHSALDYTANQLVFANERTPTKGAHGTRLPIYVDAPKPRTWREATSDFDPAATEVIRRWQPYLVPVWDDHPLAVLLHLSNLDKHRALARGRHGLNDMLFWTGEGEPPAAWAADVSMGDADENGANIVFHPTPNSPSNMHGDTSYWLNIEHGDGEWCHRPIVAALTNLHGYVRRLIDELVAVTLRPSAAGFGATPLLVVETP